MTERQEGDPEFFQSKHAEIKVQSHPGTTACLAHRTLVLFGIGVGRSPPAAPQGSSFLEPSSCLDSRTELC